MGRFVGSESGVGTGFSRMIEMLGTGSFWSSSDNDPEKQKLLNRWSREDDSIKHATFDAMRKAGVDLNSAANLESKYESGNLTKEEYDKEASGLIDAMRINTQRLEDQSEARASAAKKLQDANDDLFELEYGSDASKRMKHERELIEGGFINLHGTLGSLTPLDREMEKYDAAVERRKQMEKTKEDDREADRLHKLGLGPQDKYNEEMSLVNRLYNSQKLSEDDYAGLKKRYLKEYYDAEKSERSRALSERFQEEDSVKKRLGIHDPKEEYFRDLNRLTDARGRGEITDSEFKKRRSEMRSRFGEEMFGTPGETQTVGMMTAGSAELHTLIAKANMPDPKIALMHQIIEFLKREESDRANRQIQILQ
jgi:hypothetical protein